MKKHELIYALSLIGFFAIFSTTISKNPVLSLYANTLGADDRIIGLIAAFSPLAGIIFSFPVGMLSDKIGRKRLLITSGIVFLSAPLLYLAVQSPIWLIPIRFFHGIATAILGPVVSAMIVDKYKKNKGEMLGYYSSATLIGRTIAPIAGGFIISLFVAYPNFLNYKLVYVTAFIASIPVFIAILFLRTEKGKNIKSLGIGEFWSTLRYFVTEARLFSTALVEMAIYFAYGVLETFLSLYLQSNGVPIYQIGLVFSVQILAIALTQPLFGKIADRVDKRMQIIAGTFTLGIAAAIFGLFSNMVTIFGISVLFGLGLSFSTVATSTYVAEVTKKDKLGASLGALSSIMDIGQGFGPVIVGVIISLTSYSVGFFSCFIVSALTGIIFWIVNYKK